MEGKRHPGAVIGSTKYREEYAKDLVKDWDNQLKILSNISKTQSQAVFSAFISGFETN